MSTGKHKRKKFNNSNKNKSLKNTDKHPGVISKYPQLFLFVGVSLIVTGISLITIGIPNNAKIGLAMLSIFFGITTAIFANSALPKKQ
ncbi:MAG: putative tellurium resistance membrane protein TerC [Psychromonas sp.]|jgi:predicted tellurium resistance membrane protein TerC